MESTSYWETSRAVPPSAATSVAGIVSASTVTQARPLATAIACGLPPTAIVAIFLSVTGSMRVTVPSPLFATHTEPAPSETPVGECPTGIVAVTAFVLGSIRTISSSSVSATHTPPSPTAIPLGPWPTASDLTKPVGSTRVTLLASASVTHTASAPRAIPAGPAFGSSCSATRPVRVSRRASEPDDGATQSVPPLAATAPGPPATTLPTRAVRRSASNRGSMLLTETELERALELTTHTRPSAAAIPVGGPATRIAAPSVSSVLGSTRETVRSSRLATHSDPEPNATEPGRAPTGAPPTTRSLRMSIAASEFGATWTVLGPESARLTAIATNTPTKTAPPAAIKSRPRHVGRAIARSPRDVSRAGDASPGSWDRIARSSC